MDMTVLNYMQSWLFLACYENNSVGLHTEYGLDYD